jgi:hypothetical protein
MNNMPKINWEKELYSLIHKLEGATGDNTPTYWHLREKDIKRLCRFISRQIEIARQEERERIKKECQNNMHEWSKPFGEQSTTIFRSCLKCGKKNPNWEIIIQGGAGGSSQSNPN